MELLFIPKTPKEVELSNIIRTCKESEERRKALKLLRASLGLEDSELCGLRSKEVYSRIPGKPKYYMRFLSATILYDTEKISRA